MCEHGPILVLYVWPYRLRNRIYLFNMPHIVYSSLNITFVTFRSSKQTSLYFFFVSVHIPTQLISQWFGRDDGVTSSRIPLIRSVLLSAQVFIRIHHTIFLYSRNGDRKLMCWCADCTRVKWTRAFAGTLIQRYYMRCGFKTVCVHIHIYTYTYTHYVYIYFLSLKHVNYIYLTTLSNVTLTKRLLSFFHANRSLMI